MRARTAAAAAAAVLAASATAVFVAAPGSASRDGLDRVRDATDRYHDVATAKADGFAELRDAKGIACIDQPGAGGMGIHYVLGSRVEDPSESVTKPELVIYAPDKHGKLKLAAVEYVVLVSAWNKAGHANPPKLLGHEFKLVRAGNRYGLPPFYELHAWAWEKNKSGAFADYNPKVVCPA
jgi:hypothetical protein